MDVEDPRLKGLNEIFREQPHVARQTDPVDSGFPEPPDDGPVVFLPGVESPVGKDGRFEIVLRGPADSRRIFPVGDDDGDTPGNPAFPAGRDDCFHV